MKNHKLILLLLMVLLIIGMAGCSSKQDAASIPVQPITSEPEFITEWPENDFTAKIPKVEVGTVDYVLDDSENKRYAVFMKDISDEESNAYIQQLVDAGYETVTSADDKVVLGKMLHKDDVWLSMIVAENMLGITIIISE